MATHLCAIKAVQPKIDEEGFTTVNPAKAAKATSVEESSSRGVSSNTEQKKANQTQFEALKDNENDVCVRFKKMKVYIKKKRKRNKILPKKKNHKQI